MALIFYGTRLNSFLAVRTMLSARMRGFVEKIEERAKARGNRLSRAPFLVSCGFLYYGLVTPILMTERLTSELMSPSWMEWAMKALVGIEWCGFLLAALGDFTKSYIKQAKGEDTLVTSGVFSIFRHPNYTGEMIGWTANNLVGVLAFILIAKSKVMGIISLLGTFTVMTLGWSGIIFVLLQATRGLETRQKEQYGDNPNYDSWISSTWPGWMLPQKEEVKEELQIQLDATQIENFGSGI
jgi:protein-S-isoprenylcysteine O-methyltransferase Ste14